MSAGAPQIRLQQSTSAKPRYAGHSDLSIQVKPHGLMAVAARVLRTCADSLALPLSKLFTLGFCSSHQPAMWKVANVVPVHKKSPKSNPRNFRPISRPTIMSKRMESIMNRSLSNYQKKNDILSHRQFGFRTGLGTSDLLIALQH
ncbi:uncharacterized protein LOC135823505 [Sycon ciliatum]|uniref:uncharacterized protein LOC135823505 n=1 Tax=Sycon ciliatum TaxID=27933 RepID=UPI0031F6899A